MPVLLASVSEAQMSEEEIRCCTVKWCVFMMSGSLTLALPCRVGLLLGAPERFSTRHLLGAGDPCFLWGWAAVCCTEGVSGRARVVVSPAAPHSETEVAQELSRSQSWVFPPYVHPLLPAPPSHFQQLSWVTVSPRWRKDVSHSRKPFILNKQHSWECEESRRGHLTAVGWHLWVLLQEAKRVPLGTPLYPGNTSVSWFVRGVYVESTDGISTRV